MANQTYIRVLQAIESFANEHLQIKKFASDFPEQLPNFATKDEAYPILWVSPSSGVYNQNTNRFDLTVFCYDIIQKDRENINTILSDTHQILNDLTKWLKDGDIAGIDLINDPVVTPINNDLLDYTAGWQMTIVLEVDTYSICEIPFNAQPAILDMVNNIVYSNYLTCETLSSCGTIIDIENNLSGLTETVNGIEEEISSFVSSSTTPVFIDSYIGTRLAPLDPSLNGFSIEKNINGNIGLIVNNTNTTGNGGVAGVTVKGVTGGLSFNYFTDNYYVTSLRNSGGLYSTAPINIMAVGNNPINFRTGADIYATTRFSINSGGTLNIGVTPTTNNSATTVLTRNSSTGNIESVQTSAITSNYLSKSTGTTYTTNAIKTVTQAEYDAIVTKDPNTLYFII